MLKPLFSLKVFKLRFILSVIFLLLALPSFFAFLAYSYFNNYTAYTDKAKELVTRHNFEVANRLHQLTDPIADSLRVLRLQILTNPELVNSDLFNDTLNLHITNGVNLVSIFVASDQGSFRQVQNLKPNMTLAGRSSPDDTKTSLWVLDRSKPGEQESNFTFFDKNAKKISSFSLKDKYDPRDRPFYKNIRAAIINNSSEDFILLEDPFLSRSTQKPTITLTTPVVIKSKLIGAIGESFELGTISNLLTQLKVSEHSETLLIDHLGRVLVRQDIKGAYKIEKKELSLININSDPESPFAYISRERSALDNEVFEFTFGKNKTKYFAKLTPFDNQYNKDWTIVTIAPQEDFLVELNNINRRLVIFTLLILGVTMIISYFISKLISSPIEKLTIDIQNLLNFDPSHQTSIVKSKLDEINVLSIAVRKLKNTLGAFTSYVPRDLVNDLLKSGKEIEIGGESRYLTILFTDLQNFSGLSEITPARELLTRVSSYLELMTYAIKEELGTVDKFIGDSVMAFWGAPNLDQDHAFHACKAAIKAQRRMKSLNEKLIMEGKPPLVVRIGIHSDAVLVGNVGSSERLSYTVMGDGVNIAARLEGVNKDYMTGICISHTVFKEAGEKLWVRPIDLITVKGRKSEIPIYELLGTRDGDPESAPTVFQQELSRATERAYHLFVNGDYSHALEEYSTNAEKFNDVLSEVMAKRCREMQSV